MRNNNPIPQNRFKKTAIRYKLWFKEPAREEKRKIVAQKKAKKLYPAPLERLYPIVRGHTLQFNRLQKLGRGFTPEELEAVDLDYRKAMMLNIATDLRRKNFNEETFTQNVERLKAYLSRLTFFNTKSEAKASGLKQHTKAIMPVIAKKPVVERILVKDIESKIWAADKVQQLIQEEKEYNLALNQANQ